MATPMSALAASEPEFTFEAGAYTAGELSVLAFDAEEELSRPYSADVTLVVGPDADVDAASLVDKDALLTLRLGDGTARLFHGMVAQVATWETGQGPLRRRLRVQLVPRLWRLGHVHRSRIFQGKTAPEIVESVLKDGKVEYRLALTGTYCSRDYCVQYRESDLAFASRLLEEEGIVYLVEHTQSGDTVVLADSPSAYKPIPGEDQLVFREPVGLLAAADSVSAFSAEREVRPGAVVLRDFNYLAPALDLTSTASAEGGDAALEVYDHPGRYDAPAAGRAAAKVRVEEEHLQAETASGSSAARQLCPGFTFDLDGHTIPGLDGKYLVRSVRHRGRQYAALLSARAVPQGETDGYGNQFTCLRSTIPFRPERLTPRPFIAGPQTAIVTGPSGEEIHTDEHGRIKVQFHWDRDGKGDDRTSCWIRVAQAWAGPGFGALYLPRVGQEVVVEYLDGDPDRPIVTGSVYNGRNPPPVDLPGYKTRSTLRSSSSPGGDGSNELRLEDAAGSEEIYLHAQKDLNIVVENDKTQQVGGNETLTVKGGRSRSVGGNQSLDVKGNDDSSVGGNQTLDVTGNRSTSVLGNHDEQVSGNQSVSVDGAQSVKVMLAASELVGAAKAMTVGGAYAVSVGAAMNELVAGLKAEEVGGAKSELIGGIKTEKVIGSRSLSVGGDLSESVTGSRKLEVGGALAVTVKGNLAHGVKDSYSLKAKEITLVAEDQFLLKAGAASLLLQKNGDILLKGATVQITVKGEVTAKGQRISGN